MEVINNIVLTLILNYNPFSNLVQGIIFSKKKRCVCKMKKKNSSIQKPVPDSSNE